jgi:hypothetical protein
MVGEAESKWVPGKLVWSRDRPVLALARLPKGCRVLPFWTDMLPRIEAPSRLMPLDKAPAEFVAAEPAGLVFHMLRCGSTLEGLSPVICRV